MQIKYDTKMRLSFHPEKRAVYFLLIIVLYHFHVGSFLLVSSADKVLSYRRSKKSLSIIPGYDLDGEVTDHVTVRIPSATEEQEGKYSCHIAGVQFSENCSFTLERGNQ